MFGFGKGSAKKVKETTSHHAELSTYEDGRDKYWGLENFGSTCYANSVLQALYHTTAFRNAVISVDIGADSSDAARQNLDSSLDVRYAQHSFVPPQLPISTTKKKKGITSWNTDEEEKEEFRKRAFYPKGELPTAHPMFPDPPANKSDPAFRGQEMKPSDDTATDLFKKKLLEEHQVISPTARPNRDALLFHSLRDVYSLLAQQKLRTGILSPKVFMENLRSENEMFRQNMHHDAHEFLNYILNSVDDGYAGLTHKNPLKDTTFVHDIFEGALASEVRCLTCENITSRDESFLDLSLDIDENTSVSACMRAFSASEFLREKNKFFCESCNGLQEAERRMKIRKLPAVLALHLKRFKFEQEAQRHVKLQHVVRYETTLRIGNTTDDAVDPDRLYELHAIVVHLGGASYHGHYIACVRTDHLGWILYDDEHVERVPESVVMRFVGGEDSGTACAYVLFYRTVDIEESLTSKASLTLANDSVHHRRLPSLANAVAVEAKSVTKNGTPSGHKDTPEKAFEGQNISPPQAAYMKRATSTKSIAQSVAKPSARRMLSSVFSSTSTASPDHSVDDSTLNSSIFTPPTPKAGTSEQVDYHHGPYTGTTITSTPLEEVDEPDWTASAVPVSRPQRPTLEKKSSTLSRFSSFRGKKSLFGSKKDDLPLDAVERSATLPVEKLKRRTSVFGIVSK